MNGPPSNKVAGGYVVVLLRQIVAVWFAYLTGLIDIMTVRVYLAGLLIADRQTRWPIDQIIEDIRKATGTTTRRAKEGFRDLVRVGLIRVGPGGSIEIPDQLPPFADSDDFRAFSARFVGLGRPVPIPKAVIKLLTRGAAASLIGTALGVMVRCMFLNHGKLKSGGRVHDAWIADAFRIGPQSVAIGRKRLVGLGLIEPGTGDFFTVNLQWAEPKCAISIAPQAAKCAILTPPLVLDNSPSGVPEGKKPSPQPGIGFSSEDRKTGKPTLWRLVIEDLRDQTRLRAIYDQAVARNMARASEHGWVTFRASAAYALRVGKDPVALFFANLSSGRCYATGADEDFAGRRPPDPAPTVRSDPRPVQRPAPPPDPELSPEDMWGRDAKLPGPRGDIARRMLALTRAPGP